jgi:membrane protein YdbS with pleckstrin-like domain
MIRFKKMMPLDKPFKPDPCMKTLFTIYLVLTVAVSFLSWMVPISIAVPALATFFYIPVLLLLGFILYWIPRYYTSVTYNLTSTHIIVERGVWWRRTSHVPYIRVTNVDVSQGPFSRHYGVAKVAIQTAGYHVASRQTGFGSEAEIGYIRNTNEVRDTIMNMALKTRPIAVEADEIQPTDVEVRDELLKIRKILEKIADRSGKLTP